MYKGIASQRHLHAAGLHEDIAIVRVDSHRECGAPQLLRDPTGRKRLCVVLRAVRRALFICVKLPSTVRADISAHVLSIIQATDVCSGVLRRQIRVLEVYKKRRSLRLFVIVGAGLLLPPCIAVSSHIRARGLAGR